MVNYTYIDTETFTFSETEKINNSLKISIYKMQLTLKLEMNNQQISYCGRQFAHTDQLITKDDDQLDE